MFKFVSLCLVLLLILGSLNGCSPPDKKTESDGVAPALEWNGNPTPFAAHGKLQINNGQLSNVKGEFIQLKGMSSFGLQWSDGYWMLTPETFDVLAQDWKNNIIRFAMYVGEDGYATNPSLILSRLEEGIRLATERGMYVMIDWHVLTPGDPTHDTYLSAGLSDPNMPASFLSIKNANPSWTGPQVFFSYISEKYGKQGNILYEPANEPNRLGNLDDRHNVWSEKLKPYHESIIEVIRPNDPDGIIICGTDNWSQFVDAPVYDPIDDPAVMYAMHFYAGTHDAGYEHDPNGPEGLRGEYWLRALVDNALASGLPVFCTEWGTSEATGDGGPYIDFATRWVDYMSDKGISWCAWSMAQKNEISAAFNSSTSPTPKDAWPDDEVSVSGRFYRAMIRGDEVPMYYAFELVTDFSQDGPMLEPQTDNPNHNLSIARSTIGGEPVAMVSGVNTSGIWGNRITLEELGFNYGIYLDLTFDIYLPAAKVDASTDDDAFIIKPIFQFPPSWWNEQMPETAIPQSAFVPVPDTAWVKTTVTMPLEPLTPAATDTVSHLVFLISLSDATADSDVAFGNIGFSSNYNGDIKYVPEIPDEPGEFISLPFTFESATREGWRKDNDSLISNKDLSVSIAETMALTFPFKFEPGKNQWEDGVRLTSPYWPESALDLDACRKITGIAMDVYLDDGQATMGELIMMFIPVPDGAGYWHDAGGVSFDPVNGGEAVIGAGGEALRRYSISLPFSIEAYSEEVRVRNLILVLQNDDSDYSGNVYYDDIRFLT